MELSTNESAEDAALLNTKNFDSFTIVKKDGTLEAFNEEKIKNAITKAANRTLVKLSEQDLKFLCRDVLFKLTFLAKAEITVEEVHNTVEAVLESFDKSIADSYRNYRNYKQDFVKMLDKVYQENQRIMYIGDKENSNIDSALVSTKRSLVYNELSKELYKKFFLTVEELQAIKEGYIYIHDMSARLNCMNCFARSTRFITSKGIKSFNDFNDGDIITVLTHDGSWQKAVVKNYGVQLLQKVIFKRAGRGLKEVYCTPNHRWLLKNGKETCSLKIGDKLALTPNIADIKWDEATIEQKRWWVFGFCLGDGYTTKVSKNCYTSNISLFNKKVKYVKYFKEAGFKVTSPNWMIEKYGEGKAFNVYLGTSFRKDLFDFETVPFDCIKFLCHGYLCADGHRDDRNPNVSSYFKGVVATGKNLEFVYDMLNISGYYVTNDTNQMGKRTNYGIINKPNHRYGFYSNCGCRGWVVQDIQPYKEDEVWCLEVENSHSFILENGIVTGNCCLFDISTVLKDGFEMGNIWYNEPKTLDVAFDVIGDIVLSASAQQYGGFTVPEVDRVLAPYAQKSYEIYFNDYKEAGVDDLTASKKALEKVQVDFEQGFQGWEYKFNTVASSRGDYPFITITAGLGTGDYEKMATFAMLKVRQKGQGKKENKKPVLFPKIVFLYDEELHSEGKINYDLYRAGIECSKKAMYPDWLSLTGEGYVASMYKKYKKVISPMGCVKYDETIELETGHHKIGEVVEVVDKLYENKNKMNSLMNTPAQEIELALNPWRKCKITNKKEVYVKGKKSSNWTLMFNDISFIDEIKQTKTLRTTAYALPRNGLKIKCNNEFTSLNVLLYNTSITDWLKITYKINDVENTIQVTTDHPLPLIDGQVKRADELKVGDILIAVNHKSPKAVITNIEEVNECCRSYDVSTDTEYFNLSNDILSHNCRAFLSPWYERGGMKPADEDDKPVFVGRFNIGAVSLHLPMIYAKAKKESKDFYEVLDYYLELIRNLHRRTYDYLGEMKASTNPLAYCEGGFYGGHLGFHDKIKPLLKSATASFGITALNELQELHNGKSLVEDGEFALEVMEYINKKINEFKEQDGYLYAIYGTPAESLCYTQVLQFRKKYGIIEDVSDRLYVSNSFHCHVSEDITPIEKQDLENRFWNLLNGGKIQYVKYPISYNTKAIETLVKRAMDMGFYEGVNLSLAYCDDCGHQELSMDVCPKCGSTNLTKIERMNGYLSYSRVKGDTRLNAGKMDEIKDRKSM